MKIQVHPEGRRETGDARRKNPSFVVYFAALGSILFFFTAAPARAAVSQAQVMDVAKELICQCGTCSDLLSTCTCSWAQQARDQIAKDLGSGMSKKAIVASFVQQYGKKVLSSPPAEGFDLTAWIMPFLALILGALVVRTVLVSWNQKHRAAPARPSVQQADSPEAGSASGSDEAYLARIERELRERET